MASNCTPLEIRDIRSRAVLVPLSRPITTATVSIPSAPLVLIDVFCDRGITGSAYIFAYTGLMQRPLVELIDSLAGLLQGEEVAAVALYQKMEKTFRLLGRQGLLGMALSGLDMAFYDAQAKAGGCSVARMLGGNDDPIACYDSHGLFNATASPVHLQQSLDLGFDAVKFKIGGGSLQNDLEAMRAIRKFIGPDIKLLVDYNQSLTVPAAIDRIGHLEQFDLHWVEEPVQAEDFTGHAKVRMASNIPIQTGENWWFARDAANFMAAKASDFAMLDIMKIGGITGWLRAAALADAAATPVSSHIFVEASAHAMALTANAHMLEYLDVAGKILVDPVGIEGGTIIPKGPGLGIVWDETAVERYLT